LRPALEPVINATGVFLHTGLGRAPLAPQAVRAVTAAAASFGPVEIDLETGARGRRASTVEPLIQRLPGAHAATVVNNNAAALTIAIRALATPARPTVIVSRGELIDIGGAFRLPEIIEAAGARHPAPLPSPLRPLPAPARPPVIVSRGELTELGAAFRLPETTEAAAARLRAVGPTSRTRLADYHRAIDPTTCAILKAHPSNYRI